jgi:hypothetical protein
MPIPLGILAAAGFRPSAAGSFDLLESTVLTGSQASVEFTNLATKYASDYQHLQIRYTTRTSVSSFDSFGKITFNGATTQFQSHALLGNGSTVSSQFWNQGAYIIAMWGQGSGSTANAFGAGVMDILDPFDSNKNTTIRDLSGRTANDNRIGLNSGAWFNTAAITSILLTPDSGSWLQHSRFSLYGIKATA